MRAVPTELFVAVLLCAVPCAGNSSVESAFQKIAEIQARQENQDAATIDALEKQIAALGPAVIARGPKASAALVNRFSNGGLPLKTRLWALEWAGAIRNPGTLSPLLTVLENPREHELLRAEAAAAIASLPLSALARRRALCPLVGDESLTPLALREVLLALAGCGCERVEALEKRLRSFGNRPKEVSAAMAEDGLKALGRTLPVDSTAALLRLAAFYPDDSPLRARALEALWHKREELKLEASWREDLRRLAEESGRLPAAAAAAIKLLAYLGEPESIPLLLRFIDSPRAENAASAAEALAALKAPGARAKIERLLANIHQDERFAPGPGRANPRGLIIRIEAAYRNLLKKLPQDDTVRP